ncbi:ArnT family glycosyltransferase [Microbacterium sp. GCS4]|uniref:ArnT family glycosyltransferase n=1 Tax=Microbacterium sp. GCS4 TaxID=1692239 RepID=UPI0006834FBF|nr:glycosyltransferase family 39 protein [Microbacterium sp. GCS4]
MTTMLDRPLPVESGGSTNAPTPSGPSLSDRARRAGSWLRDRSHALVWLIPVLAVSAIVNFLNVGGAPQRIDDEGTYTAQAWAVTHLGELAHYTYWYDHPPLGWLQIAGYTQLTGAFERWDIAVLAGREAVLVASLISVVLVWMLTRRLGMTRPASAIAALIFAISPLAVQFHRTVYLDNVAMPWLLLAFVLAMNRRGQLAAFAGSALAFGIAVLTKETFLLALPFLIWVMLRSARRETRRYTLSVASSILVLIGGSYLLLAAVKGELFSGAGRVSLMDGITFQLGSREGSGSIFDPDSLINRTLGMWWQLDPVFIVLSLLAAIAAVFMPRFRPHAVLLLTLTAFMFRPGGYLPVPYVIMLIPFGAVLVAGVADAAIARIRRKGSSRRGLAFAAVGVTAIGAVVAVPLWTTQLRGFVLADLDQPLRDAQEWLIENAGTDQRVIVDDAMWVDLVKAGWDRDNVIWYYKLDTDPAVQAQSPNGWRDADYVVTTDSMRTFPGAFPQVQEAIDNSVVVATFGSGTQAVDVRRVTIDGAEQAEITAEDAAENRAALGTELASNPEVELSDADRDRLIAGQVDARIIAVLATLAGSGSVTVSGFPIVDGEDGQTFRQLALSEIDGAPTVVDGAPSAAAQSFVDALTGAYAPSDVAVDGDDLVLRFPISLRATLP